MEENSPIIMQKNEKSLGRKLEYEKHPQFQRNG